MKRLFILLAGVLAGMTVLAATASATEHHDLTLQVPVPATLVVGGTTVFQGTFDAEVKDIAMYTFPNSECDIHHGVLYSMGHVDMNQSLKTYSGEYSLLHSMTYWFRARGTQGHDPVWSECRSVVVTEATPPVTPPVTAPTLPYVGGSSYLCWNQEMVDPVAYLDTVADTMWLTGKYFEPQAILGNVVGGTNIGAYHLVCNQPNLTPTGFGLGGSGEIYTEPILGLYHSQHANAATTNDLNVYHIYK